MEDVRPQPPAPGLVEVGQRPPFFPYVAEAWQRRSFAWTLAKYRLSSDLLKNRLGFLWLILRPLATAAIYGTIFGAILSNAARPDDWVPYLITGVFTFQYFTGCVGSGSKAITGNARLVQSLGFPRILLPISIVMEQTLRVVPIFVLLMILLPIFGVGVSWSWLLLPLVLLLMAIFNFGVVLIAARLSVWARDVQQVIPIVNRVLFYASSIFFQLDQVFADQPAILTIAHLVPTYDFIALVRDVMLNDHPAPLLALIAAPVWAILALAAGVLVFWKAEARYGLSD
ncbi:MULTISPECIES: ABC transporter permease [Microbacterium]|uniref:ABC transporter permease n=1 Tax=Microbacterium TaxID=33882 RepID=UPI001E3A89F9|nr:ABC transporter permease [Microbacterium nymphoidis]MCD2498723.1 ABC transporter permease [Microbacterium nymphoidis]